MFHGDASTTVSRGKDMSLIEEDLRYPPMILISFNNNEHHPLIQPEKKDIFLIIGLVVNLS